MAFREGTVPSSVYAHYSAFQSNPLVLLVSDTPQSVVQFCLLLEVFFNMTSENDSYYGGVLSATNRFIVAYS